MLKRLSCRLVSEDRDFLRLLVLRDGKFLHFRFCRVPFGLCCSPALLNTTLIELYNLSEVQHPACVALLRRSVYCDDFVSSVRNHHELHKVKETCTQIFRSCSMNLRGWTSTPDSVLGVPYDSNSDSLVIDVTLSTSDSGPLTRRDLVSALAKIYDPLGFAAPCFVAPKLLIQESWDPSITWDSPLSPALVQKWRDLQKLHHGQRIHLPRCLNAGPNSLIHAFSDASGRSYATCVYLVNPDQSILLFAKTRIVPIRSTVSIPRKELMGAVLSVRAVKLLKEGIPEVANLSSFFWTDSTCVLSWMRRPAHDLRLFVRNRIAEIQSLSSASWRHVPGAENPADIGTRKVDPSKLSFPSLWTTGPSWLSVPSEWPAQPSEYECDAKEVKVLCVEGSLPNDEHFYKCSLLCNGC